MSLRVLTCIFETAFASLFHGQYDKAYMSKRNVDPRDSNFHKIWRMDCLADKTLATADRFLRTFN